MSAANAKVQEPSMEEILASIRRIIADDQTAKSAEPLPEPMPDPVPVPAMAAAPVGIRLAAEAEADVLDLADFASHIPEEPLPPLVEDDIAFAEEPEPEPEPLPEPEAQLPPEPSPEPLAEPAAEPAPAFAPVPDLSAAAVAEAARAEVQDRLLSRSTDTVVSTAFNSLAHTILTNNPRTLEDLVGDMLRPMLKTWLDDNLPTIVERLVRAEIERVARGR